MQGEGLGNSYEYDLLGDELIYYSKLFFSLFLGYLRKGEKE